MDATVILVTGGAGFIGSNFVRRVLAAAPDRRVITLDSLTYAGNLASLGDVLADPRHRFVRGSVTDAALLDRLLGEQGVDGIIHFAAESHVDRSILGPEVFIDTNVRGTLVLLQAARRHRVRRFLQVSTDEVYGELGPTGLFREDSPIRPNSPYSASKASADHLVHAFHRTYGLDTVITRCSNNYGPYQFPEKMIPLMIHNAMQDKPLPVYGDGLQVRDWIYVDDHCDAVWRVFGQGRAGEVYNIGGNSERTNLEVVRTVLRHLGKPESLIRFVQDRPGHDRRYAIDTGKMARDLGWKPAMAFDRGIGETIHWYRSHPDWLAEVVSGAYQKYYEEMYGNRPPA